MSYLLDTCVISELVRPRPDRRVSDWIERQDEESLFVSVLTIGEIQTGVAKLADVKRKSALQRWLDRNLRSRFADRVLPINEEVALTWGLLNGQAEQRGIRIPIVDGLIGATAIAFNLVAVTRDDADIGRTGARVLNPWRL